MPTEDVDVATGRKSDGSRQTCTEERRTRGVAPDLFVSQRFSLAFWWRCLVKNRLQSLLKAGGSGAFDGRISVPLRMSKNWKTNNKTHSFGRHMLTFF